MTKKSHLASGILVPLAFLNPLKSPFVLVAFFIGSMLPDTIDYVLSFQMNAKNIWNKIHRRLSHWWLLYLGGCYVAYEYIFWDKYPTLNVYVFMLCGGALLHLFLDSFTKTGIPFLNPFGSYKKNIGFKIIKNGETLKEYFIVGVVAGVSFLTIYAIEHTKILYYILLYKRELIIIAGIVFVLVLMYRVFRVFNQPSPVNNKHMSTAGSKPDNFSHKPVASQKKLQNEIKPLDIPGRHNKRNETKVTPWGQEVVVKYVSNDATIQVLLDELSSLWKKKEAVIKLEELSKLWRTENPDEHLINYVFNKQPIQDFFEKYVIGKPYFGGANLAVIVEILRLLDERGECPSVVQRDTEIIDRQKPAKNYDIFTQIPLWQHSLHVGEEIIKLIDNAGVLSPKLLIAALGHDLGKIDSFDRSLYSLGDHPRISIMILEQIPEFEHLIFYSEVKSAILNHHTGGQGYVLNKLKEADANARQREFREYLKKSGQNVNIAEEKDFNVEKIDVKKKENFADADNPTNKETQPVNKHEEQITNNEEQISVKEEDDVGVATQEAVDGGGEDVNSGSKGQDDKKYQKEESASDNMFDTGLDIKIDLGSDKKQTDVSDNNKKNIKKQNDSSQKSNGNMKIKSTYKQNKLAVQNNYNDDKKDDGINMFYDEEKNSDVAGNDFFDDVNKNKQSIKKRRPQQIDISFVDIDDLIVQLDKGINKMYGDVWFNAISMKPGYVFFRVDYVWLLLKEQLTRRGYEDIALRAENDQTYRQDILLSLVDIISENKQGIAENMRKPGYFGGPFYIYFEDGTKKEEPVYYMPFSAHLFGDISELESRKNSKLRFISKIIPKHFEKKSS